MQLNGIGSSHSDAHHVTTCIHEHKQQMKEKTGAAAPSESGTAQQLPQLFQQSGDSFGLSAWLQNTLLSAKKLLGRIWGSDIKAAQGDMTANVQNSVLHNAQIEAASVTVQPTQNLNNNPYFATITESTLPKQTIWQKAKVRFQSITGFLAKRFSFSNGSSFQTKKEQHKEDLRRHSRYRKDDVEIDCIITDDSFLMDSYNKKGEYSKLSTGK